MNGCLFCGIVKKSVAAEIVYEDQDAVAFLDIHPRVPGHTMVVPKVHAETILELPDSAFQGVFVAVKRVTALLQKTLRPRGFTIGINHGKVSGQVIDHLHIHILPRFDNDQGSSLHSVVNNPPQESIEVMADKIRNSKY